MVQGWQIRLALAAYVPWARPSGRKVLQIMPNLCLGNPPQNIFLVGLWLVFSVDFRGGLLGGSPPPSNGRWGREPQNMPSGGSPKRRTKFNVHVCLVAIGQARNVGSQPIFARLREAACTVEPDPGAARAERPNLPTETNSLNKPT